MIVGGRGRDGDVAMINSLITHTHTRCLLFVPHVPHLWRLRGGKNPRGEDHPSLYPICMATVIEMGPRAGRLPCRMVGWVARNLLSSHLPSLGPDVSSVCPCPGDGQGFSSRVNDRIEIVPSTVYCGFVVRMAGVVWRSKDGFAAPKV
jgi:hypothetical protein